ncbi:MAG TPA: hypothetical protein VFP80_14230, partial [Thermoanaerobaculia bacterium]|nr:hypothetical protein [Thermoanaerobaculia bacterium]
MSIAISSEAASAAVSLDAPATARNTVFLGQGAPLDDAQYNPAVAINSDGNITLVHTEGATMYHRFGSCRAGTVDWRGAVPIRDGSLPDVSNTPAYAVVAFRDDSSDPQIVRALVGAYGPSGITWTGGVAIDAGDRPSIAVNEAGRYV